jgi:hypothetical protein
MDRVLTAAVKCRMKTEWWLNLENMIQIRGSGRDLFHGIVIDQDGLRKITKYLHGVFDKCSAAQLLNTS